MELVDKIAKIDPNFAAAIRSCDARDIINSSPWGWFFHELKRVPGIDTDEFRPAVKIEDFLSREYKILKPGYFLSHLQKGGKFKLFRHDPIIYRNPNAITMRIILECNAKDYRADWFRFLIFLCKKNKEHTTAEAAAGIGIPIGHFKFDRFPNFVAKFAEEIRRGEGKRPRMSYKIMPAFYNDIYMKMNPWLTKEGYEIFEEWKQTYNR